MSSPQPLPVSTASDERSIWRDIDQARFRQRILDLQQVCNETPGDPKLHLHEAWHRRRPPSNDDGRILPFEVEERLCNDLAFLVANQKDAKTVSAVALEEHVEPSGLVARLAANGAVQEGVVDALQAIFSILERCAQRRLHRTTCRDLIFDKVVALNRDRIHGRLQSSRWIMPGYMWDAQREPLKKSLRAFAQRVVPIAHTVGAANMLRDVDDLCFKYQSVDDSIKDTDEELRLIKAAVKQSHIFCTPEGMTIEETIANYGLESAIVLRNKHVRQVEKIARYWGLCKDLALASRRYSNLFKSVRLEIVPRYQPYTPPVVFPNKAIPCHVHAEIQLVTFYGMNTEVVKTMPRVLGVSKAACYLCDLFIFHHKHFFISKTHGRLYHQWNVPDLEEFSQRQLLDYRYALAMLNAQLQTSLVTERRNQWRRGHPLESWQALRSGFPTSPLPSSVGTLLSGSKSPVASAVTSGTVTPRARSIDPSPPHEHKANESSVHEVLNSLHLEAPSTGLPASSQLSLVRTLDSVNRCHAGTAPQQDESPSRPASSIASLDLPVQRAFTAVSPFRARVGSMSLVFETEGTTQGSVAIARIFDSNSPMAATLVDIDTLKPGEVRRFARGAESEHVVLNLNQSQSQSIQMVLRWL